MRRQQRQVIVLNGKTLMALGAAAILLIATVIIVVTLGGGQAAVDNRREPLADRAALAASPIQTEHYRTTRALDGGELARMAQLRGLVRAGELAATQVPTSEQRDALWYDEATRTLALPDSQQMTDAELSGYIGLTDSFGKRSLTISAVGDVVLGGEKRHGGRDISNGLTSYDWFEQLKNANGADYFLRDVAPYLNADDLTVINLEGTLTKQTKHVGGLSFSAPPGYVKMLKRAGIDAACIVNNHSEDFYRLGLDDTRDALRRAGIAYFWKGANYTTTVQVKDDLTVGLIGSTVPVNFDDLRLGIEALRAESDVVVASFHWTGSKEFTSEVTDDERVIARSAIDMGADLVLGHHKHQLSGLEKYNGKMIVYDLGSFLSTNVPFEDAKFTMIYQQTLDVYADGSVATSDFRIIPCLNSDAMGDEPNDGHVHPADEDGAKRVAQMLRAQTTQQELWPLIDKAVGTS